MMGKERGHYLNSARKGQGRMGGIWRTAQISVLWKGEGENSFRLRETGMMNTGVEETSHQTNM